MTRLRLGVVAGSIAMAACAPAVPPARKAAPLPPTVAEPAAPPPIADYMPGPSPTSPTLTPRHPGDDGGVLIGGIRVTLDGKLAPDSGVDGLVGGERVEPGWGGGFLFWTFRALYVADTFSAPLKVVAPLASQVKTISYGPGFILVRTTEGLRFAVDAYTHAVAPPSPVGLVEVAAVPEGPAVALMEDGRALLSIDDGQSWNEIRDLGGVPNSVSMSGDRIWLELVDDGARRLEPDGSFSPFANKPSPPRPPGPASTCGATPQTLLSAAVSDGLPLAEEVALAPLEGAVVRVNLRTGQCLEAPKRIAPGRARCELVAAKTGPLAVCDMDSRGAIVFSDLLEEQPTQEIAFERRVEFHEAAGHLIADGPCSGKEPPAGIVCVRDDKGAYKEYDRRDERWSGWISRWIPKDTGGAVGITTEPEPAWIDAVTGARTELKDVPGSELRNLLSRRGNDVVERQWHVAGDGTIHGWHYRKHVSLRPDGVTTSPFSLNTAAACGSRSFGFDRLGHAWQTLDDGNTWTEVLGPPSYQTRSTSSVKKCSPVGCDLQGWLRMGWRTTPPKKHRVERPREPVPTTVLDRPTLQCNRTGSVTFLSFPAPVQTERETSMLGFGARVEVERRGDVRFIGAEDVLHPDVYAGMELGLRALSHQRDVSDQSVRTAGISRTIWHTMPFDPNPEVRSTRLSLGELAASAPGSVDGRRWLETSERGSALPVLAADGRTQGYVLTTSSPSPLVWIGGPSHRARALSLGLEDLENEPISLASRSKDELLVLVRDDACSLSILEVGARSSKRLSSLPKRPANLGCSANRDVLALGHDGTLGVVRTPSGHVPPSAKDPALLLVPGRPAMPLAPWSTLKPASDPACKKDRSGYQAIVMTAGSWLDVTENGQPVAGPNGMLAWVTWSTQRVCVHAVEVDAGEWSPSPRGLPTTMVARFGDAPAAGRVGVGRGEELRIPMECKLVGK